MLLLGEYCGKSGLPVKSAAGDQVQSVFCFLHFIMRTLRITLEDRVICTAPITWIVKQDLFFENWEKQQKLCRFHKKEGEKLPNKGFEPYNHGKSAQNVKAEAFFSQNGHISGA